MKNIAIIIVMMLCACFVSQTSFSQTTFEKRILPKYWGGFNDIIELSDHTFMASGAAADTNFFDGSNTINNIIAKFDTAGNMLWLKCWGGINQEQPLAFHKVNENGNDYFLQLGYSNSFYHIPPASQQEPNDLYFVKYDMNGDTIWTRDYGPSANRYYLTSSVDGYYIVGQGISLIKVNPMDGDTIWTRKYDLPGSQTIGFSSVSNTLDSGYYLTGGAIVNFASDYHLLKTDSSGNVVWCYVYGDTAANRSWAITTTLDGGAIMVGESSYNDSSDVLVVRTNAIGDTLWCKTYDYNNSKDVGRSILLTQDNGCIISASSIKYNPLPIVSIGYIFSLDSAGTIRWSNTYTGGFGAGYPTYDGGFVGASTTLGKADSLGNSCTAQPITLTAKSFPLTVMPVFPTTSGGLNKCVTTNSYQSILANTINEVDNCIWVGEQLQTVSKDDITVYPNPVLNQLTINNWHWANKEVTVTVYDVIGKQKLQCKFTVSANGEIEMDVSSLEKGIYFLRINSSVQRFVKM